MDFLGTKLVLTLLSTALSAYQDIIALLAHQLQQPALRELISRITESINHLIVCLVWLVKLAYLLQQRTLLSIVVQDIIALQDRLAPHSNHVRRELILISLMPLLKETAFRARRATLVHRVQVEKTILHCLAQLVTTVHKAL